MQGADRVNEELEVGFNEPFEKRWLRAEQVGRVVMTLFVAAGLTGLMGRGPYSHRTNRNADQALAIDFEPVARSQTGTQLTFHLSNATQEPTVKLFVGGTVVEPMGLQRVLPEPVKTETMSDGLLFTVAVPPGTQDARVRLMLQPVGMGVNTFVARLEGHAPLHWTQFVVP